VCNSVIVDSCGFTEPETDLLSAQDLLEGTPVADLNWLRLSAWELTAEAFDPPQRRCSQEVDRVTIDYEKGSPAQALMFWVGWRVGCIGIPLTSNKKGDYDIKRIQFVTDDQRQVKRVSRTLMGEIPGDLIALR